MEAVETKPRRIVARGSRRREASEKVRICAMLNRRTVARLSAYARWIGKDPCQVIEDALGAHLTGVRVSLPGDNDGQETPDA